jgi:hypothetical protein
LHLRPSNFAPQFGQIIADCAAPEYSIPNGVLSESSAGFCLGSSWVTLKFFRFISNKKRPDNVRFLLFPNLFKTRKRCTTKYI